MKKDAKQPKDFIDFILAAQTDKKLVFGFLQCETLPEYRDFFQENGFDGISDGDIRRIQKGMKGLQAKMLAQTGCDYY